MLQGISRKLRRPSAERRSADDLRSLGCRGLACLTFNEIFPFPNPAGNRWLHHVGSPVSMLLPCQHDTHYSCMRVRPVSIILDRDPQNIIRIKLIALRLPTPLRSADYLPDRVIYSVRTRKD